MCGGSELVNCPVCVARSEHKETSHNDMCT